MVWSRNSTGPSKPWLPNMPKHLAQTGMSICHNSCLPAEQNLWRVTILPPLWAKCLVANRNSLHPTTALIPCWHRWLSNWAHHWPHKSYWKQARQNICIGQAKQKKYYDRNPRSRKVSFEVGGRVMVYMPQEAHGKNWKLSLPYYGPCRIIEVESNCLVLWPVTIHLYVLTWIESPDAQMNSITYLGWDQRQKEDEETSPKGKPLPLMQTE